MHKERGNASLFVILGVTFLVAVMQVVVISIGGSLADEEEYLRERQLRCLSLSAAKKFVQREKAIKGEELCHAKLYPSGGEAKVYGRNLLSEDDFFRYFDIHAVHGKMSFWLRQTIFKLNPRMYDLGTRYMFLCQGELLGGENLSEDNVYKTSEEVYFPQVSFLKQRKDILPSRNSLDVDKAVKNGLSRSLYYIYDNDRVFTFAPYSKIHGTAVVAAEKGITIGNNSKFLDRVIFLAHGPCRIEDYTYLAHALIIASGPVTIGTGCQINGVIFSGDDISLQGPSTFTHAPEAVASFWSALSLQ